MALHTKTDFASLCGLQMKHFNTYVDRKKIVLTGEYVNDTDEANALFIEKRKKKTDKKGLSHAPLTKKNEPFNDSTDDMSKMASFDQSEIKSNKSRENLTYVQLEKEKKLADLAKTEAETIYKNLQIEKVKGQNIPTDLVKNVISILSKSLISSFKDGSDSMLIEISKRKKLSGTETAELKGVFIKIINEASGKAVNEARKNIKIIANDFSEKREVGEHD